MARSKKQESIRTTGFGDLSNQSGRRFYRKDGTVNLRKTGLGLFARMSSFHSMIAIPQWKFWTWLGGTYIIINLIIAVIYYYIGVEYLVGIDTSSKAGDFAEAFFFSAQ